MSISLVPEVPSSEVYGTVMLREHVYRSQDRIFELEIENARWRPDGQNETVRKFHRIVKNAPWPGSSRSGWGDAGEQVATLEPTICPGPGQRGWISARSREPRVLAVRRETRVGAARELQR